MRRFLITLSGLALVWAACAPAPTPTPFPTSLPLLSATPTARPAPTQTPFPTLAVVATPTLSATEALSSTTSLFPSVTEADWQLGSAEAPITIIEYGDYQCPQCSIVAPILAQLQAEFPDEVRIVYRHFPLFNIHDKAILAAEAAEAAGAQGKFWEMHAWLYERQTAWEQLSPVEFRKVLVESYAPQLGLDATRFAADLDNHTFIPRVQAAYEAAAAIKLPGTPLLVFNGTVYQGPINHWALKTLVLLEQLKRRQYTQAPEPVINPARRYLATLHTAKGEVLIALFANTAPISVNNFVFLAREGWYDGVTFHRVLPGLVAQTGDPSNTGYGGPGYFIPDEIDPHLKFDAPGWVGLANAGPNSNGSQFFITLGAIPELDGKYTIFGQVVAGMEVVQALTPRDPEQNPEAPLGDVLLSVTIEEK